MPDRLQLSRKKGSRLPEGARSVARPSDYGNPFRVGELYAEPPGCRVPPLPEPGDRAEGAEFAEHISGERWLYQVRRVVSRAHAVALFIAWSERVRGDSGLTYREMAARDLAGRPLACWCPIGEPCHADALLAMAAGKRTRTPVVEFSPGKSRIRVQRGCNGCGGQLGDATGEEAAMAACGVPLPDVRRECPGCGPKIRPAETWRERRLAMAGRWP
jgi:hypothetical protein